MATESAFVAEHHGPQGNELRHHASCLPACLLRASSSMNHQPESTMHPLSVSTRKSRRELPRTDTQEKRDNTPQYNTTQLFCGSTPNSQSHLFSFEQVSTSACTTWCWSTTADTGPRAHGVVQRWKRLVPHPRTLAVVLALALGEVVAWSCHPKTGSRRHGKGKKRKAKVQLCEKSGPKRSKIQQYTFLSSDAMSLFPPPHQMRWMAV